MMKNIRVSKEFHFEMAHALWNYDGPCKNIHGHSYKLIVTLAGVPLDDVNQSKNGMLIDFSDLKAIVNNHIIKKFDHALLISKSAEKKAFSGTTQMFDKLIITDYQPTCENILLDFVEILLNQFPDKPKLHNVRLYETATSFAEWFAGDNP